MPSLQEQGLRDFDVTSWFGLFAPAGTPADIITRLNTELRAAAATPEAREKLAPLGMEPAGSSPQDLRNLVQQEQARWRELIRVANIKAE